MSGGWSGTKIHIPRFKSQYGIGGYSIWSWVSVPSGEKQPRPKPMTITWTLTPKDGGTLLTLEHSGAENIDWLTRNMMRVGWGHMMKKMITRILTHVEAGEFRPGAIPLEKRYYTCKTIPEEYVR